MESKGARAKLFVRQRHTAHARTMLQRVVNTYQNPPTQGLDRGCLGCLLARSGRQWPLGEGLHGGSGPRFAHT